MRALGSTLGRIHSTQVLKPVWSSNTGRPVPPRNREGVSRPCTTACSPIRTHWRPRTSSAMRSASAWTWSASPREERHEPQHRAAILTGGCFWGVQALLRHRDGVIPTRVGYTGGKNDNPTYGNHPGHAEAVEIVFDPKRISYRDILEFFFQIHHPTTKDRQGNDIVSSYRSEVFYTSEEQRQVAEDTIADVEASGIWPGKVVTEVSGAVPFGEADPEHQDYLQRYPNGYPCHFPRPGWKLPHRQTAA